MVLRIPHHHFNSSIMTLRRVHPGSGTEREGRRYDLPSGAVPHYPDRTDAGASTPKPPRRAAPALDGTSRTSSALARLHAEIKS
jgi:hypothetical protein